MTGTRRKARRIALKTLYEVDSAARSAGKVLERYLAEEDLSEANRTFVRGLVNGVIENQQAIDGNIARFAPAWPVDQLAIVDRNILRLAIFEILFDNKVPVKVAVSEAVELAKTFGSNNSARFINGVLGTVSTLASR
jgi:N utilization substance protein B